MNCVSLFVYNRRVDIRMYGKLNFFPSGQCSIYIVISTAKTPKTPPPPSPNQPEGSLPFRLVRRAMAGDIAYHANRASYCIDIDNNYVTETMAEELT